MGPLRELCSVADLLQTPQSETQWGETEHSSPGSESKLTAVLTDRGCRGRLPVLVVT